MHHEFLRILNKEKINISTAIIFSLILYIFFTTFPYESSKEYLLSRGVEGYLYYEYGLWGFFNDLLYSFFNFLIGNFITGIDLMNNLVGFQLSIVYFFTSYKIIKLTSPYSLAIFLSPFLLNYFALCTRDAIALGLFFLITSSINWKYLKMPLSLLISLTIHKGIIPLILLSSLFSFFKNKSKKFFLMITFISILLGILFFILLRYSEIFYYLPNSFYKQVLSFPRRGYINEWAFLDKVNLVYNFYGNFNFKLLALGILGQLLIIFFKSKISQNIFPIIFSVFFILASFNSFPNADRFVYHAFLVSTPFFINLFINEIKEYLKKYNS